MENFEPKILITPNILRERMQDRMERDGDWYGLFYEDMLDFSDALLKRFPRTVVELSPYFHLLSSSSPREENSDGLLETEQVLVNDINQQIVDFISEKLAS